MQCAASLFSAVEAAANQLHGQLFTCGWSTQKDPKACETHASMMAVGLPWCMCFPGAHFIACNLCCSGVHMRVLAPAARCMGCYVLIPLPCTCCVVGLVLGGFRHLLIAHSVVTLQTVLMYTLRIPTYLLIPYSYNTALHRYLKSPMNGLVCWCFVSVVLPGSLGAARLLPAVLPCHGPGPGAVQAL